MRLTKNIPHLTSLEKIFFLLFLTPLMVSLFYCWYQNISILALVNKRVALALRYNQLNKLRDARDYRKSYNKFISPDLKKKFSEDEYIDMVTKDEPTILKREISINEITIEGNIGYIDRTIKECANDTCSSEIQKTVYKKWIFEDGNWYPDGEEYCNREKPYEIAPEFERAISLYKQRMDQHSGPYEWQWLNCVDVQYASIPDAEGYFTYDMNSPRDRLTIFVNNSYKIKDDLLTAFLLSHELNHAWLYIASILAQGANISCFDNEIAAFTTQLNFFTFQMNNEERNSLIYRIPNLVNDPNSPIQQILTFSQINLSAISQCGYKNADCLNKIVGNQVSNMVRGSLYYQQQCSQ